MFLASGLLSNQAYSVPSCVTRPTCSELGYKENICNCSNALSCPFDESWKVCLSGDATACGTCKSYNSSYLSDEEKDSFCNLLAGNYKCSCTEVEAGGLDCYKCTGVAKTCKDYSATYLSAADKNAYCNNVAEGYKCSCTEAQDVNTYGLECYSSCNQVAKTCKDYNSSYLSVSEKSDFCSNLSAYEMCNCTKVDNASVNGLTCYSKCEKEKLTCATYGYMTESEKKSYCDNAPAGKMCQCSEADEQDLYEAGLTCYSSCEMVDKKLTCEDKGYYSKDKLDSLKAKGCDDYAYSEKCQCTSVSGDAEIAAAALTCYDSCSVKLLTEAECKAKYGHLVVDRCGVGCYLCSDERYYPYGDEECGEYLINRRCDSGPGA